MDDREVNDSVVVVGAAGAVVVASDLLLLRQILDAIDDAFANGLRLRFAMRISASVVILHFSPPFYFPSKETVKG